MKYSEEDKLNKKYELQIKCNELFGDRYKIIGDFINTKSKIEILDNKCGKTFTQRPLRLLEGIGCDCTKKSGGLKKLTKEIVQERSNEIHNFRYEIISEYINSQTKIKILDKVCGKIFEQKPSNHLLGKGCNFCLGPNKSSKEELQEKSNKKHNFTYEIIGEFLGRDKKIKIKHLICGTIFETTPASHLLKHGCCSICFKNEKSSKEKLQEKSNKKHNFEYEILGEYKNCDTHIEIKHLICGNIFKQTPYKHLHNNKCPICFGKNKLSKEILQKRSDEKYNNEYTILGDYINNETHILIRHNKCGEEYKQSPNNHLRDRPCFRCRGNISIGELKILTYLEEKNIDYVYNNSFEDCKLQHKLRFDFYLPEKDIFIEFDGEQHFKPIEKFGGVEHFEKTLERDNAKNEWCKNNNKQLIRIKFNENVVDKLNEIINI